MNWVDISLLVILFIFVWAGTYRGLIMEIVDILTAAGGFIAATHLYPYGAILLKMLFKKMPVQTSVTISFIAFFVISGILIMLIGAALELANKIPIAGGINRFFGGAFALVNGIVLLWGTVVLVNLAPLNDAIRGAMNKSIGVKVLIFFNPVLDFILRITTSSESYKVIHSIIEKAKF